MFVTRLLSGIVLLTIACTTMGVGGIWLLMPLLLISIIAYRELTKALETKEENRKITSVEIVGMLGVASYYIMCWNVAMNQWNMVWLLACIMFVFMIQMLLYVVQFPKFHASKIMSAFFAFIYAPVMLSFIFLTRQLPQGMGFYLVWLILISSWGCDTCAYAVGVLIGKHKIFPLLSPKKSLEGCIGGVAGAALIGAIYGQLVVEKVYPQAGNLFPVAVVISIICGVGAIMSMVGDLAASAIKRNNNIKDYGKLIPGHGGIMDRFDSTIVTAPMTYFLAILMLSM